MTNDQRFIDQSLEQEIHKPLPLARVLFNQGMNVLAFVLTAAALLPLFSVLFSILRQGFPGLMKFRGVLPEVLISLPAPEGVENVPNGFANAIVGTLILVGIACLFSIPVGVMTGVFLSEFHKGSAVGNFVRFVTVILSSVPSIIVGVFAYSLLVLPQINFILPILNIEIKTGFSALAGGFALGLIMLPIIALSTEEALKLVPTSVRLASAALGGGRFQTTFRVVLASALPAITTGALLAVARAAGETAPLVFTALFSEFWPQDLFSPMSSLAVLIFNYASSPYPNQIALAWTASVVLIALVLISSILSRQVTRKRLKNR